MFLNPRHGRKLESRNIIRLVTIYHWREIRMLGDTVSRNIILENRMITFTMSYDDINGQNKFSNRDPES
jgi:hypothetical protein